MEEYIRLAVMLLLGWWTLVYILWECLEDVVEDVWRTAGHLVHVEVHRAFVEPLVLRRLRGWEWTPRPGGRTPRSVFIELQAAALLGEDDRTTFHDLCLASLRVRHRLVPEWYLRRCLGQILPLYLHHNHTLPQLWGFLAACYNT